MAQTIWISAISWEQGIGISAHPSEDAAYQSVIDWCVQFWDSEKNVSGPMPTDRDEIVEAFFDQVIDTWEITEIDCATHSIVNNNPQEG